MSCADFQRATQCLAYTNLAALRDDRPDTSALAARVANELALRPTNTKNEVRDTTLEIRLAGANAATLPRVKRLKAERAPATVSCPIRWMRRTESVAVTLAST